MKKSFKIMGMAAMVLLLAVSCKKEDKNGFNGETKFMTFSAGISQGNGKTSLNGLNLLWSDGEKININNAEFNLTEGAGTNKGEFSGEAAEAETYYAVYPATGSISGNTATVTLTDEQPYVDGSFAKDIAPMVAKTDDSKSLTFTNVCGLLRLDFQNITVPFKKIVLQSAKSDELLAGEGTVEITGNGNDKFVITNGTGNAITVTSNNDITTGAKIVFVLPEGTLTTGFYAYFYANEGDNTPFDNISTNADMGIVAGQMNDVTVNHEVKMQSATILPDGVTTTATTLTIPYVIQEECVSASIQCATDADFMHIVDTKVVVNGTKDGPWMTGNVTFTGLSAATSYYVRILVKSAGDAEEKPYCTIVAETSSTPAVTEITLNKENLELLVGEYETLTATVLPEDAIDKGVTWSSSAETVATVDEDGKVTAVAAGSATITVTSTADNTIFATCGVTVVKPAAKFSVSASTTVEFAPGNLWYGIAEGESSAAFHFEANQWDYSLGDLVASGRWNWDPNHVCHFFWSNNEEWKTSDYEPYAYKYTWNSPTLSDVFFTNATETTANPDFHVNGETGTNTWRTLSIAEWKYLLGKSSPCRNNASSLCAWVTLTDVDVKGLVILPDGTDPSVMSNINTTAGLATYDAVFLPAAGRRNSQYVGQVDNVGAYGNYWSSTLSTANYASYIYFGWNYNSLDMGESANSRQVAYAVRLVR